MFAGLGSAAQLSHSLFSYLERHRRMRMRQGHALCALGVQWGGLCPTCRCYSGHRSFPLVSQPNIGVWRPRFESQLCWAHFSTSISLPEQNTLVPPLQRAVGDLRMNPSAASSRSWYPLQKLSTTRTGLNLHPLKDALGSKTEEGRAQ